jgi:hypothetical protein
MKLNLHRRFRSARLRKNLVSRYRLRSARIKFSAPPLRLLKPSLLNIGIGRAIELPQQRSQKMLLFIRA